MKLREQLPLLRQTSMPMTKIVMHKAYSVLTLIQGLGAAVCADLLANEKSRRKELEGRAAGPSRARHLWIVALHVVQRDLLAIVLPPSGSLCSSMPLSKGAGERI